MTTIQAACFVAKGVYKTTLLKTNLHWVVSKVSSIATPNWDINHILETCELRAAFSRHHHLPHHTLQIAQASGSGTKQDESFP